MKEQREKSALVEFKEESVTLRNEMEAAQDPQIKRGLRFRLKSAKFWELLMEGLIFVLLLAVLSGCNTFRETMHLGGAACQDVGWLLEKGADNITTEK